MIEAVLLLAIIVLAIMLQDTRGRLTLLEKRRAEEGPIDSVAQFGARAPSIAGARVNRGADGPPSTEAEPVVALISEPEAKPIAPPASDLVAAADPVAAEPAAALASVARRFEALVGGRLPIWTGGIALAFAGFFLVRYSIELGLFGPGARSLLAAAFGLALLALSEFGPKVPWLGGFVGSDKRIAQSLAGAGIATLYGTLYMASELYGLIGIGVAFVLVVVVTVLALALSLRHGPPTAIMGLAGGYLAPYVAGLPESSLTSTLLYLGVFTLGLTGLAVYRRWSWLALAAGAANLVWTGSLLVVAEPSQSLSVGVLIVIVVIALLAATRRAGPGRWGDPRWSLALLTGAAVELVILNVASDFPPFGWLLYGVLAAAAIFFAWRDPRAVLGVWIAFIWAIVTLVGSFLGDVATPARLAPALGIALLFGAPAQLFARRGAGRDDWLAIAVLAPLAPLLAAMAAFGEPRMSLAWAVACIVAALPIVAVARAGERRIDAVAEAALFVLAAALVGFVVPGLLYPPTYALLFVLAAWARRASGGRVSAVPATALVIAGIAILLPAAGLVEIVLGSVEGELLHYASLPSVGGLALALLLPALIIAAAAWRGWTRGGVRRAAVIVAVLAIGGFAYAIAKQPLAIDTTGAFVAHGFLERAVMTQVLMLGAWLAARRAGEAWVRIALSLAVIGLFRFVYFDLVLLNPVALPQAVGSWPLFNAATLLCAGTALWCWLLADLVQCRSGAKSWEKPLRYASLAAMMLAVLVSVRQGVNGSIIAGQAIGTSENYLYSAALLLLALAWIAVGIARRIALLRIAGLALLTVVTLKVFLVDAAVLAGLLRVVSFLGLGAALIGIGWAYGKLAASERVAQD